MKNLLFAAALLCAPMTMTACQTTGAAPNVHMTEGRAISAAASTLKFAEDSAAALVASGSLKGVDAAKASADIKLAHSILVSAAAAYRANASVDLSAQIAQAAALAAEVLTIVSAHK
jgi:hypothetical protein